MTLIDNQSNSEFLNAGDFQIQSIRVIPGKKAICHFHLFECLSNEMIHKILGQLNAQDLGQFLIVSKRLSQIALEILIMRTNHKIFSIPAGSDLDKMATLFGRLENLGTTDEMKLQWLCPKEKPSFKSTREVIQTIYLELYAMYDF